MRSVFWVDVSENIWMSLIEKHQHAMKKDKHDVPKESCCCCRVDVSYLHQKAPVFARTTAVNAKKASNGVQWLHFHGSAVGGKKNIKHDRFKSQNQLQRGAQLKNTGHLVSMRKKGIKTQEYYMYAARYVTLTPYQCRLLSIPSQ